MSRRTAGVLALAAVSLLALGSVRMPPFHRQIISQAEAVRLAFDQLGPDARPTAENTRLSTAEDGVLVWVVTFDNVCGEPNLGPRGNPFPDCAKNTMSIALDAATGEFIVAG
jgi:hypothetical protein